MVIDDILPKHARRNYTNVFNGINQVIEEGVAMRGAALNGISLGLLMAATTPLYDYLKEYLYNTFGAARWLRFTCLSIATLVGSFIAMPFENLKVRLHTMSALPDGRLPYNPNSIFANLNKIHRFEGNYFKYSNSLCTHNGFSPFFIKNLIMFYTGLHLSDLAFDNIYQEGEFVDTGNYYRTSYVKNILHDPINRQATLQRKMDVQPTKKYFTSADQDESFEM